jgi:hypothetical protein
MGVTVEMHNTGDAKLQRDVVAMIEHVLSDRGAFLSKLPPGGAKPVY